MTAVTARLVLGVMLVLPVAGCGGTKLRGSSIAKPISGKLGARGYPGAKVQCPDVDNKVGKTFTCTVSGAEGTTRVDGTVAKGDRFYVDRYR
jgi:hypothetical protein